MFALGWNRKEANFVIVHEFVRAWTPALQPATHSKKQRPFSGDPGLETGGTFMGS